jgi:hypothetical protein
MLDQIEMLSAVSSVNWCIEDPTAWKHVVAGRSTLSAAEAWAE